MTQSGLVTAVEMARAAGVDPKRFRAALRAAQLGWHGYYGPWKVIAGSAEHRDLQRVLNGLAQTQTALAAPATRLHRTKSDEAYVIDLCDEVLDLRGLRQHRFPFLLGDTGRNGQRRALPVDAYYPQLGLVVEYEERQHSEATPFFDRRGTVSGVPRGKQRALYDARRRETLPLHGLRLVRLPFAAFAHDSAKRLKRVPEDRGVVAEQLAKFTKGRIGDDS